MPLADGRVLAQALIVFAVIGLLGLVLRWTFSHDVRHPTQSDAATDPTSTGPAPADPTPDTSVSPQVSPPVSTVEDFGLLATVAMFDTREDANRVRALLADAGIRATTSVSADGRYRVLVFSSELDRARRVGGGSA